MTVNVSITFPTIEDAVAFLAGKPQMPAVVAVTAPAPTSAPTSAPASAPTPAPTPAKAAAAPKAAPAPAPSAPTAEEAPPQAAALDFKRDVVEALRGYSKAVPEADFRAYMSSLGAAKVSLIEQMPDKWADIVAHCKANG